MASESMKALLAKPNPDANYFSFILGELAKIGECRRHFQKYRNKTRK